MTLKEFYKSIWNWIKGIFEEGVFTQLFWLLVAINCGIGVFHPQYWYQGLPALGFFLALRMFFRNRVLERAKLSLKVEAAKKELKK